MREKKRKERELQHDLPARAAALPGQVGGRAGGPTPKMARGMRHSDARGGCECVRALNEQEGGGRGMLA